MPYSLAMSIHFPILRQFQLTQPIKSMPTMPNLLRGTHRRRQFHHSYCGSCAITTRSTKDQPTMQQKLVYCLGNRLKWQIDALVLLGRCVLADTRWDCCNNYSPSSFSFQIHHNSRMLLFSCSTNWWFRIWRRVFVVVLKCVVCAVGVGESAVSFIVWIEFVVVELHWIPCLYILCFMPEWFCNFKVRDWFHLLCYKT